MSRSWRKSPVLTNQQRRSGHSHLYKNRANKRIRQIRGSIGIKGSRYKKLTRAQYEICDYILTYWTRQAWEDWKRPWWKIWGK